MKLIQQGGNTSRGVRSLAFLEPFLTGLVFLAVPTSEGRCLRMTREREREKERELVEFLAKVCRE